MQSADAHRGPPEAAAPERPNEAAELSTAAPSLAAGEVQALMARLYGIHGTTVRPLAGERDLNCAVETADGTRYVFKICNAR